MSLPTASPRLCRRTAATALFSLCAIVVTGAAVRLTQSGLGCPTWPECTGHRLYATWRYHSLVEFGNRMVTLVVVAAAGAALVAAWRRRPYRRDLTWLAAGVVGGVVAQAVLGGITVLVKLSPPWVMAHFMLSIVVIGVGVVLWDRARRPDGPSRLTVPARVVTLSRVLVATTFVALAVGTVVTGAGPHSGSTGVARLGIPARDAAELHAVVVMFLIGTALAAVALLEPAGAPRRARRGASHLLVALALQGAIGYTQYFTGVPAALVGLHVAGAVVIWVAVLRFHLSLRVTPNAPAVTASARREAAAELAGAAAGV